MSEDIVIQEGTKQDELKLVGIMSKGYGIIPKAVMLDRRLTDKAKAIYAFFCSFAGAGNSAFPRVATICYYLCMNKDTYYKHFKMLVEYGYIEVQQVRNEDGQFSHNVYVLKQEVYVPIEETEEQNSKKKTKKSPRPKNSETGKPNPKISDTVNSDTEKSDTVFSDTNNNNSTNNKNENNNNNNLDNYLSINLSKEEEKERQKDEEIKQLFDKMQIDQLNEQPQTIEALKALIKDMYFSNRRMSVDGTSYHPKHIREAIQKLTLMHLEHALEQFKQASRERKIKNPTAYMKRILFNSVQTLEFNTTAEVQFEVFGSGHMDDEEEF